MFTDSKSGLQQLILYLGYFHPSSPKLQHDLLKFYPNVFCSNAFWSMSKTKIQ